MCTVNDCDVRTPVVKTYWNIRHFWLTYHMQNMQLGYDDIDRELSWVSFASLGFIILDELYSASNLTRPLVVVVHVSKPKHDRQTIPIIYVTSSLHWVE